MGVMAEEQNDRQLVFMMKEKNETEMFYVSVDHQTAERMQTLINKNMKF